MITQLLKRKIAPDSVHWHLTQGACFLTALLVLVLGFLKLPHLDLTEGQLLLGVVVILSLTMQCVIVCVLVDLKRDLNRKGS